MSLHYYKLLLLSTEDDNINGYNDYFEKKVYESHTSALLSTEDSKSKCYNRA